MFQCQKIERQLHGAKPSVCAHGCTPINNVVSYLDNLLFHRPFPMLLVICPNLSNKQKGHLSQYHEILCSGLMMIYPL